MGALYDEYGCSLFQKGLEQLKKEDPKVFLAMSKELNRQELGLELIASENYVSPAVLVTQGSVFTNKYAEGYPHKRYYGGCAFVDEAEVLAQKRCQKLFQVEASNVQPHSGSQANMAAYYALLNPGDRILGMDLSHGGHLTHGSRVNFSGKFFEVASYGVHDQTGKIDYDQLRDQAKKYRPRAIIAGASAYPRFLDFKTFREIAAEVGAFLIVDMAHIAGLVAAGIHPSPIGEADLVTSTTHKTLRGPRGGFVLGAQEQIQKVNKWIFPGLQGGPLMHVIVAKAVAFEEALQENFRTYQEQVVQNAKALAGFLQEEGFDLVSGGTDNHLLLVDFTSFEDGSMTGKEAEKWLEQARMTVNKNTVPGEKRSPFVTSGIRIGVPAVTTRGLKVPHMKQLAHWIQSVIRSHGEEDICKKVAQEVEMLCKEFPVYYK